MPDSAENDDSATIAAIFKYRIMFASMKLSFKAALKRLQQQNNQFDSTATQEKLAMLNAMAKIPLSVNQNLGAYADMLLFICAHPSGELMLRLAEKELGRIANFLKGLSADKGMKFLDSGLPYAHLNTRFSHDFCCWLNEQTICKTEIDAFTDPKIQLIDALKFTLPSVEREYTTTGCANDELMDSLLIHKNDRLSFILAQFQALDDNPLLKDHVFDSLDMYLNIIPKSKLFSKAYNRIPVSALFYHDSLIKKFDHISILNSSLPEALSMDEKGRRRCIDVIKLSMAITARETDPATFMDENSFRLFKLERGIAVAIYGMKANRQMPNESYIGFTLFKNGFPASYGGGWVFGKRSLFGINIFEAFRGGESGYMMCQILRVYRQLFGVEYFEAEPYQYGADNPDGIKSGAFWFYYRYGFRPLDKTLLKLSNDEYVKIQTKKGYRSSEKTLLRFTESNIALNLGNDVPMKVSELVLRITKLIQKKYRGDRELARIACCKWFREKSGLSENLTREEERVFSEVAFVAAVVRNISDTQIKLFSEVIRKKPVDVFAYQQLLLKIF